MNWKARLADVSWWCGSFNSRRKGNATRSAGDIYDSFHSHTAGDGLHTLPSISLSLHKKTKKQKTITRLLGGLRIFNLHSAERENVTAVGRCHERTLFSSPSLPTGTVDVGCGSRVVCDYTSHTLAPRSPRPASLDHRLE